MRTSVMGSSSSQPVADSIHRPNMDDLAASQQLVDETTPGLLPSVFYENMAANATMQPSLPRSKRRRAVSVRISRKEPSASPAMSPVAPPPPPPPIRPARRSVYEIPLSDDEDEGRGTAGGWPVSPAVSHARHRTERSNKIEVPDSQPTTTTAHAPAAPAQPVSVSVDKQSSAQNIKRRSTWARRSRSTVRGKKKKDGGQDSTIATTETIVASSSQIEPKLGESAVSMPALVSGESDIITVTPRSAIAQVPAEGPTSTLPKPVRRKTKKAQQRTRESAEKENTGVVEEVFPEQSPRLDRSLWTFRKTKPAAKDPEPEHIINGMQDNAHSDGGDDDPSHLDIEPTLDDISDVDMPDSTVTQNGYGREDDRMDIEPDDEDTQVKPETPVQGRYNVDEDGQTDESDDDNEESQHNEPDNEDDQSQNDESDENGILAKLRHSPAESRTSGSAKSKGDAYSAPTPATDASEWSESSSGEDEIPPSAPPNYQGPAKKRRSNIKRRASRSSECSYGEHQVPDNPIESTTAVDSTTAVERALNKVRELQDPPNVRSTGPFTWDEEEIIRRAVRAFQVRKGLDTSGLVEIIQSTSNDLLHDRRELWRELKTHTSFRDEGSVRQHVRAQYHMFKTGGWTDEEDEQLKKLARLHPSQWTVIARLLNRTRFEINSRWRDIQKKGFNKSQDKPKRRWSKWELCRLLDAVTTVAQRDEDSRAEAGMPPRSEYSRKEFNWSQVALEMGNIRSSVQCYEKWDHLRRRADPPKITINIKPREADESDIRSHQAETEEEPVQPQMIDRQTPTETIQPPISEEETLPEPFQVQVEEDTQAEPVQPRLSEEPFQLPVSKEQTLTEPFQPQISVSEIQNEPARPQMSDAQTQAEPILTQMKDAETQAESVLAQMKDAETQAEPARPQMKDAGTQAEPIRPQMKDAQTQTELVLPQMKDAQTLTQPVQTRMKDAETLTESVQPWMSGNGEALTKCQCQCQCQNQPPTTQATTAPDEGETVKQQQSRRKVRESDDTPLQSPQVEEEELAWIPQAEEEELVIPAEVTPYSPQNRRSRRTSDLTPPESPQQEEDEGPMTVVETVIHSQAERRKVKKAGVAPPQSPQEEEEPTTAMRALLGSLPTSRKAKDSEATLPVPRQEREDVETTVAPGTVRGKRKRRRKSRKSIAAPPQSPQAEEAAIAAAKLGVETRPAIARMLWGDKFDLAEAIFANEQESKDQIDWADVAASLKRPWPVDTLQAVLKELFDLVETREMVDDAASFEDYMFAIMDFLSKEHGHELEEHYQSDAQVELNEGEKVGFANLPNSKKKRKRTESRRNSVQHSQASVVKKQKRASSQPSIAKGFRSIDPTMESDDAGSDSGW